MRNKYIRSWVQMTLLVSGIVVIMALCVKAPIDFFTTGKFQYQAYLSGIIQGIIGSAGFFALVQAIQYTLDKRRSKK